jgi:hypothetical protein
MPTYAFVPVWNGPAKRRRLRKWLYDASPPLPAKPQGKAQSLTGLGGIPSVVPIRCQGMEALAALGAACLAYKPGSSANLN